jgi:hypothetical protein
MRLDIAKIDDRIRKLQELRRLAADPEMVGLLSECLVKEDEGRDRLADRPSGEGAGRSTGAAEDASDVVREVLEGTWNRRTPR